jgi:hypothetical protein
MHSIEKAQVRMPYRIGSTTCSLTIILSGSGLRGAEPISPSMARKM